MHLLFYTSVSNKFASSLFFLIWGWGVLGTEYHYIIVLNARRGGSMNIQITERKHLY